MKLAPNAPRRIYLASSWRNPFQPMLVGLLREWGHDVYDFRNPAPDNDGFRWSALDPDWQQWTPEHYTELVTTHPVARAGFGFDLNALNWCDTCVLLLPSGRSAHLEAGYAAGQGKRVIVYLMPEGFEPELMYLLCSAIVTNAEQLHKALRAGDPVMGQRP
jgi:hypothetical protein